MTNRAELGTIANDTVNEGSLSSQHAVMQHCTAQLVTMEQIDTVIEHSYVE